MSCEHLSCEHMSAHRVRRGGDISRALQSRKNAARWWGGLETTFSIPVYEKFLLLPTYPPPRLLMGKFCLIISNAVPSLSLNS